MTPMNIRSLMADAANLGCTMKRVRTGDPRWKRVFVTRPDNCQIGRLSFKDDLLTNWKWYKSDMVDYELDESDKVYAAIEYYIGTGGQILGEGIWEAIIETAHENVQLDLEIKKANRAHLPPSKNRKALKGKSPRREAYRLLRELIKEANEDGRSPCERKTSAGEAGAAHAADNEDHCPGSDHSADAEDLGPAQAV
jgi:hypothetical protein